MSAWDPELGEDRRDDQRRPIGLDRVALVAIRERWRGWVVELTYSPGTVGVFRQSKPCTWYWSASLVARRWARRFHELGYAVETDLWVARVDRGVPNIHQAYQDGSLWTAVRSAWRDRR